MKKIKAFVINHGHMDIEWYQPLATFSRWFCQSLAMLDEIAQNDPDYACYTYDGVVYPVLYAMRRDQRLAQKVKSLLSAGKLRIGPFYTQFDEFLISGEHMIKNCLWGDRKCRELNTEAMKAGYLLDNFGHPAQLPQILNNFGIQSLFFSRGMCDIGDDTKEFLFQAPDGSAVVAQNFSYSAAFRIYENNAPQPSFPHYLPYYDQDCYLTYEYITDFSKHIDHEGIAKQLIDGVKANAGFYPSGIVPLFVGADHCPPQEGLTRTLALANSMQDEIEFLFTDAQTLSEELGKVSKALPVFRGDLIGCKFDRLFFGAMTTRAYLKRIMYDGEQLLYNYALPLAAVAKLFGHAPDTAELDEATELLLINGTHDSIHGSSLDSVHRENEYRFDRAAQLCAGAIHDSLAQIATHLTGKPGYREFVVFSPVDYNGYVSAWLLTDEKQLLLTDGDGVLYETAALPQPEMLYNAKGEPYYRPVTADAVRQIIFKADLPAGQVKKFYYKPLPAPAETPMPAEANRIQNEFYCVEITEGHLTLTDREKNRRIPDFLRFTEEAEAGDSFDHSAPWLDAPAYCSDMFGFTDAKVTDCGLCQQLTAKCTMRVPLETVGDVRSRSLVDMPILVTFRLWKGVKRVDMEVRIQNYAKNHRVRAEFCLPDPFDSVKAGELFCAEDFSLTRPPMTKWWKEPHTKELPMRDWVSVLGGDTRYTLCAKGLYTFEPLDDRRIAITLFRSIGELMRIHIQTRSSCCAAGTPVEDAQCLREMTFHFTLFTRDADAGTYEIQKTASQYLCPPAVHALRKNEGIRAADSAFVPFRFLDNNSFALSVFEPSFDGEYTLLRFYEVNGQRAKARIDLSAFRAVYLSDMNETLHRELAMRDGVVELDVPANKIVTLLMKK